MSDFKQSAQAAESSGPVLDIQGLSIRLPPGADR